MVLYTIGHSAHPIEKLLYLLRINEIQTLVDVRSVPASRFHPQYNQRRLESALNEAGIQYVYLGQALGGRPTDPACYPPGEFPARKGSPHPRPDFEVVMQQPWFKEGIDHLLDIIPHSRTAILCSEEDPARCHRNVLIAEYLQRHNPEIEIRHIRGSGQMEFQSLFMGDPVIVGRGYRPTITKK